MSVITDRLAACFQAVSPDISIPDIQHLNLDSVETWDSVATVTLFAIIEEEFGIDLTFEDVKADYSFNGILNCLTERANI